MSKTRMIIDPEARIRELAPTETLTPANFEEKLAQAEECRVGAALSLAIDIESGGVKRGIAEAVGPARALLEEARFLLMNHLDPRELRVRRWLDAAEKFMREGAK